jgi:phage tail protein X
MRTVAVVGGGHPEAARLARAIRERRPHLADWAPTIAGILGITLPDVDGEDLRYAGAMVSR